MTEIHTVTCASCFDDIPDPDFNLCNGCVQAGNYKCASCEPPKKTETCVSCRYATCRDCSVKMHGFFAESGHLTKVSDIVCAYSGCMDKWVERWGMVTDNSKNKLFVCLDTVCQILKQKEIQQKREKNTDKKRKT